MLAILMVLGVAGALFVAAFVAGVFGGSGKGSGYSGTSHPFAIEAHYLGSPDSPVTVVIWQDFICADCRSIASVITRIKASYVDTGKARLQYRHFPSGSAGSASFQAAEATECAAERGAFWDYSNKLLARGSGGQEPNKATFEALAVELGFNKSIFAECLGSQRFAFSIEKERTQGKDLGLTAPPAILVNGVLLSGDRSYEAIAAAIESALAEPAR